MDGTLLFNLISILKFGPCRGVLSSVISASPKSIVSDIGSDISSAIEETKGIKSEKLMKNFISLLRT